MATVFTDDLNLFIDADYASTKTTACNMDRSQDELDGTTFGDTHHKMVPDGLKVYGVGMSGFIDFEGTLKDVEEKIGKEVIVAASTGDQKHISTGQNEVNPVKNVSVYSQPCIIQSFSVNNAIGELSTFDLSASSSERLERPEILFLDGTYNAGEISAVAYSDHVLDFKIWEEMEVNTHFCPIDAGANVDTDIETNPHDTDPNFLQAFQTPLFGIDNINKPTHQNEVVKGYQFDRALRFASQFRGGRTKALGYATKRFNRAAQVNTRLIDSAQTPAARTTKPNPDHFSAHLFFRLDSLSVVVILRDVVSGTTFTDEQVQVSFDLEYFGGTLARTAFGAAVPDDLWFPDGYDFSVNPHSDNQPVLGPNGYSRRVSDADIVQPTTESSPVGGGTLVQGGSENSYFRFRVRPDSLDLSTTPQVPFDIQIGDEVVASYDTIADAAGNDIYFNAFGLVRVD